MGARKRRLLPATTLAALPAGGMSGGCTTPGVAGTPVVTAALASRVDEGFSVQGEVTREMTAQMDAASRDAMTAKGFGGEAHRIARLMSDRYNIGLI